MAIDRGNNQSGREPVVRPGERAERGWLEFGSATEDNVVGSDTPGWAAGDDIADPDAGGVTPDLAGPDGALRRKFDHIGNWSGSDLVQSTTPGVVPLDPTAELPDQPVGDVAEPWVVFQFDNLVDVSLPELVSDGSALDLGIVEASAPDVGPNGGPDQDPGFSDDMMDGTAI
jgi:hypothetical protein